MAQVRKVGGGRYSLIGGIGVHCMRLAGTGGASGFEV